MATEDAMLLRSVRPCVRRLEIFYVSENGETEGVKTVWYRERNIPHDDLSRLLSRLSSLRDRMQEEYSQYSQIKNPSTCGILPPTIADWQRTPSYILLIADQQWSGSFLPGTHIGRCQSPMQDVADG
jgi:hypothetical protein